jgi:hypothetical protein
MSIEKTILILMFWLFTLFAWWSLAREVESGKPFELNHKRYIAIEVKK